MHHPYSTVYLATKALGSLSSVALSSPTAHSRYHGVADKEGDISKELSLGTFLKSFDNWEQAKTH